jgi:type IV pilus assembly protein PilA
MFCPRCGTANPNEGTYCLKCGNSLETGQPAQAIPTAGSPLPPSQLSSPPRPVGGTPPTSGKAIASLICGLFTLFLPASVAAIVLGHMSLSEIRKSAGRIGGAGIATAGLVLGYIGIALIPVIFLIVAAIAIPNLLRARMAANEASAVGTLRTIDVAATTYTTEFENGFPASFEALGDSPGGSLTCDHASLLDGTLVRTRQKSGYIFTYTPKRPEGIPAPGVSVGAQAKGCTSGGASGFEVKADPIQRNTTGARSFFSDESGVIRYSINGSANVDSSPIH